MAEPKRGPQVSAADRGRVGIRRPRRRWALFPWGEKLDAGYFANFADANTNFPWRDATIDDGFPETAPVGSYPRGASPFGIEDLAGNVFEWCLDFYEPYRGKELVNPRGPANGAQRNYRGGSWRSQASSLRASARHYNLAEYSSNDVGFQGGLRGGVVGTCWKMAAAARWVAPHG